MPFNSWPQPSHDVLQSQGPRTRRGERLKETVVERPWEDLGHVGVVQHRLCKIHSLSSHFQVTFKSLSLCFSWKLVGNSLQSLAQENAVAAEAALGGASFVVKPIPPSHTLLHYWHWGPKHPGPRLNEGLSRVLLLNLSFHFLLFFISLLRLLVRHLNAANSSDATAAHRRGRAYRPQTRHPGSSVGPPKIMSLRRTPWTLSFYHLHSTF